MHFILLQQDKAFINMSEINFEEKSYNFWNWLKNNGATLSDNMAIKDYRSEGAGRGIVATKAIKVHTQ